MIHINFLYHHIHLSQMTRPQKKRKSSVNEVGRHVVTWSSMFTVLTCIQCMLTSTTLMFILASQQLLEASRLSDIATEREPVKYQRKKWSLEQKRFSDTLFYRLFRMYRACFLQLCLDIEAEVGTKEFKSEQYLQHLDTTAIMDRTSSAYHARKHTSGDTISGEWKVALTLRMMAGATYLDMYLWSNVSTFHICKIFNHVTKNWINAALSIDIYDDVMGNENKLHEIINAFSKTSDGILTGCIGALDGWLVPILCPKLSEVNNPGKYFARKGFYALNVQVICDKEKRVTWRSIGQIGSIHDSRAFNITSLAAYLKRNVQKFIEAGVYFVGDSAYALRPYLLTPYDNAGPGSKDDVFNYFLSRNRIYVECVFGEVNRRFGIFWRPLEGSLERHVSTIDAALKLHNYIVEYRLAHKPNYELVDETLQLEIPRRTFNLHNPGEMEGMMVEEALLQNARGRKTNEDNALREEGVTIRDDLRDSLWDAGLRRPQ